MNIAICYRCDAKYKFFLINSIASLLKYYKSVYRPIIYICTNESVFEIPEVEALKSKYQFEYIIVKIDKHFFDSQPLLKEYSYLAARKFIGFRKEFHYSKTQAFNNTTRPYNPFARSKMTQFLTVFFLSCTEHERVLHIDTDTIITDNVATLFDYDISEYCLAACRDWINYHTFSPSVMVVNTLKWREISFKRPDGLLSVLTDKPGCLNTDQIAFGDKAQQKLNSLVGSNWLELDKNWNVPITHMHLYHVPKIYHFSESWSGRAAVHDMYKKVLAKYLDGA